MSHKDAPLAGASSSPAHRGARICGEPPTSPASSAVSPQPFFGGGASINQISGRIASGEEVLAHLSGHWVRGRPPSLALGSWTAWGQPSEPPGLCGRTGKCLSRRRDEEARSSSGTPAGRFAGRG